MERSKNARRRQPRRSLTDRDIRAIIRGRDGGGLPPADEFRGLRPRARDLLTLFAQSSDQDDRDLFLFWFFAKLREPDQQALRDAIRANLRAQGHAVDEKEVVK